MIELILFTACLSFCLSVSLEVEVASVPLRSLGINDVMSKWVTKLVIL